MQFGSSEADMLARLAGAPVEQVYFRVGQLIVEYREVLAMSCGITLTLIPLNPINWACSLVVAVMADLLIPGPLNPATKHSLAQTAVILALLCNTWVFYQLVGQ